MWRIQGPYTVPMPAFVNFNYELQYKYTTTNKCYSRQLNVQFLHSLRAERHHRVGYVGEFDSFTLLDSKNFIFCLTTLWYWKSITGGGGPLKDDLVVALLIYMLLWFVQARLEHLKAKKQVVTFPPALHISLPLQLRHHTAKLWKLMS